MTATAYANDPLLDRPLPTQLRPRPQLRLVEQPTPVRRSTPVQAHSTAHVRATAAKARSTSAQDVEVFRRRRFMVALALTLATLLVCQMFGIGITSFGGMSVDASEVSVTPAVHVVRPGDTYAGIAAEFSAEQPAVLVETLRAANGNADLVVGERLVINLAATGGAP